MLMVQNKYVIRFLFISLFLMIFISIIMYRYFMIEEIIVKQVNIENTRIAELYKKQVWDNHKLIIPKLKTLQYQNLLTDVDFIEFIKHSVNFFKNINAQVSIFDMYGNRFIVNRHNLITNFTYYQPKSWYNAILTTIDAYFLRKLISSNNINVAFKGKSTYALWPKVSVDEGNPESSTLSFISSYIPIIDNNLSDFIVDSVIEIDTDITKQWQNIVYIEKRALIIFIIMFLIFFSIVLYNTNYAQRIINRQFEMNKGLEEAKIKAESESSAKTEFLAKVSHELRTPLNAIIGFSEIIISQTYGKIANKQYQEYIHDINNSGKHLLSVINDILDFSKAAADKLKVDIVELDLNKLASSSMRFVKPRADEAGVKLVEDLPKEHIIIKADPKRLKQALLNLLSNAVKFTPEGASVTLSIVKDVINKIVYVQVVDQGIGISEKDIPKALSTFGQVDNKLSRQYEGTGLGLPLTKKLVELMNGSFELQSSPGIGTSVTLTFKYDDSIEL